MLTYIYAGQFYSAADIVKIMGSNRPTTVRGPKLGRDTMRIRGGSIRLVFALSGGRDERAKHFMSDVLSSSILAVSYQASDRIPYPGAHGHAKPNSYQPAINNAYIPSLAIAVYRADAQANDSAQCRSKQDP